MDAPAQQGHSIVDEPTTVADCQRDYAAHTPERQADAVNQLGQLGTGQQHTHRH
ncbi:hypothetical protein HYE82_31345 [Streptomyces sp. BR123]|uniref:hypothetical protein n=1 Tax=Streptomyces sp. BR123 TaxID=2749828 RepID=UPI0015C43936|nr:hypothetical protein [Streptomyces sp. BR123]NXY98797.1 hypothetical protein [Streptomyces sp. BR123]